MNVLAFPYSQVYIPAMPALEIVLGRAGRTQGVMTISALIDTGSDGTLMPINALEEVGARYVSAARLRTILGNSQPVDIYVVSLRIGPHTLPVVRVAAMAKDSEPILGRNVLNQLAVMLNGLAGVVELAI